jgi:glucose-6-phosphate isomerase
LYQLKIFVHGVIWEFNSFGACFLPSSHRAPPDDDRSADQMGVELGKILAKMIFAKLEHPEEVKGHDSSVSLVSVPPRTPTMLTCSASDNWVNPLTT